MFDLACMVLFLVSPGVFSNYCNQKYDVTNACGVIYGNVLNTINATRSFTACCILCSENDRCLSVKYDPINRECQLNSERLLLSNTECPAKLKYATKIKNSCNKFIDEDCTTHIECAAANGQCLSAQCKCPSGQSYRYANESCLTSCDVYGNTFTAYPGFGIYDDTEITIHGVNIDICKQACIDETIFFCLGFDFSPDAHQCYITASTALTGSYQPTPGIIHGLRNCQ